MPQFVFGPGNIYAIPLTTYDGTAITVPTPVQIGTMQAGSVDFSWDIKELYGQRQFPVAAGRGKGKIAGKATYAQFNAAAVNSLVFGQTQSSALCAIVNDVTGTAIPGTPFQITVTPPLSGTYLNDLGVVMNGIPMTQVASGPTTGQYSHTAGVYTFATADVGQIVFINYSYTAVAATAADLIISNPFMGYAPTFSVSFSINYNGKNGTIILNSCTSSKFSVATKLDDFAIPEFDFTGYADANQKVGRISFSDK